MAKEVTSRMSDEQSRMMMEGIEGCSNEIEKMVRERLGEEEMNASKYVQPVKVEKKSVVRASMTSIYKTQTVVKKPSAKGGQRAEEEKKKKEATKEKAEGETSTDERN